MKKLILDFSLPLVIVAVTFFSSCSEKVDDMARGMAEFSVSMEEISDAKSGDTTGVAAAYHLLVSVEDKTGNEVLSDTLIPIYLFGSGFVSEKVEIPAGEFRLTKFMVVNASGAVIYAAPVAGSPLAYLTNRPLPVPFVIRPGQTTRIVPEVLAVLNYSPGDFGYLNFGMQIIKPLTFYTVAILDNPLIMAPVQWTEAILTVYDNRGWHYRFKLEPAINRIVIRGGSSMYTLVVEKPGFMPVKLMVPAGKLMETTRENPLILRIPVGDIKTLVLQPGPDEGKDAMISNLAPEKNFGDHPYFEATFLSDSILTVMIAKRSLIWFDMNSLPKSAIIKRVVLRLSFERPIIWPSPVPMTATPGSDQWFGTVLRQITEEWDEDKVTWNTEPATIESNQVYIGPFMTTSANFIDVDVTRLIVNNLDVANYGMLFRHYPSEKFPGFRFASSDHPYTMLRPKMTIFFTLP